MEPMERNFPGTFSLEPARGFWFLAAALLLLVAPHSTRAAERQILKGHIPTAATVREGPLPDSTPLRLAIGLPLRNQPELEELLRELYDPHSPRYRRFLAPEQFTAEFGPTQADYQKAAAFAESMGLRIEATYSHRLVLDVSGTAGRIGKAFHVNLHYYRRPDKSLFYAPDAEPSVELDVPLLHVSGLDNYHRPWPKMRKSQGRWAKGGRGAGGTYQGMDFRDIYLPGAPATLNGAGQTVALVEFGGFYPSDITQYQTSANPSFTAPAAQTVLCDGFNGTPGTNSSDLGDNDEVSLDIEMVNAMAPGAQVLVFEGPDTGKLSQNQYDTAADDIFAAIAARPQCREISCSWGGFGDATAAAALTQMAAQGQGYYEAVGDYGAFVNCNSLTVTANQDPSLYLSPYETLVGGTSVNTTNPSGPPVWSSETTWNDSLGAGGGGICTGFLSIPSYQAPVPMGTNGGSTQWRDMPDISMVAANLLFVAENAQSGHGYSGPGEGTSFASPLWAAFAALVNQEAEASGKGGMGFANPSVYSIGLGSSYANDFHDVADGSNNYFCTNPSSGPYTAVSGFDLATGWGSPKGTGFITDLVALAPTATPSPTATFTPTLTFTPTVTSTPGPMFSAQARPNITDGRTPVHFVVSLPAADKISLSLYNVAGEMVYAKSLQGSEGTNTLTWAPQNQTGQPLASGIYLYYLQAGDGSGGRTKLGKLLVLH